LIFPPPIRRGPFFFLSMVIICLPPSPRPRTFQKIRLDPSCLRFARQAHSSLFFSFPSFFPLGAAKIGDSLSFFPAIVPLRSGNPAPPYLLKSYRSRLLPFSLSFFSFIKPFAPPRFFFLIEIPLNLRLPPRGRFPPFPSAILCDEQRRIMFLFFRLLAPCGVGDIFHPQTLLMAMSHPSCLRAPSPLRWSTPYFPARLSFFTSIPNASCRSNQIFFHRRSSFFSKRSLYQPSCSVKATLPLFPPIF